jgi:HK97 gp10 family phage protein
MSNEYSSGVEAIFDVMDRHNSELDAEIDQEIQAAGIECRSETVKKCPVGTPESTGIKGYKGGRLRSSYQYQRLGPRACKVWTNVFYAKFVELGTKYQKARPHFFPAFETAKKHLEERLKALGV